MAVFAVGRARCVAVPAPTLSEIQELTRLIPLPGYSGRAAPHSRASLLCSTHAVAAQALHDSLIHRNVLMTSRPPLLLPLFTQHNWRSRAAALFPRAYPGAGAPGPTRTLIPPADGPTPGRASARFTHDSGAAAGAKLRIAGVIDISSGLRCVACSTDTYTDIDTFGNSGDGAPVRSAVRKWAQGSCSVPEFPKVGSEEAEARVISGGPG